MKIKSSNDKDPLNVLWDGGAIISLITFDKAKELNLIGEPVKLSVVKVGGLKVEIQSSVYALPLTDKSGNSIEFQVYGIDKISSCMNSIDVAGVMHLFDGVSKTEHWMKNRICPKFAWCKYVANMKFAKLCNQCKGGDGRIRTKTSKFGHHHTCTGCKANTCSIFAQGKFDANSFFRPVEVD